MVGVQTRSSVAEHLVNLSPKMHDFCYERAKELARAYDVALSAGLEEAHGHAAVMGTLGVPRNERKELYLQTLQYVRVGGLAGRRLSPINQFLTAVVPYIMWCLRNYLPGDEEANHLLDNEWFPIYLQQEIAWKVAQEVGGALWCPLPWLSGKVLKLIIAVGLILLVLLIFWR